MTTYTADDRIAAEQVDISQRVINAQRLIDQLKEQVK